MSTNVESLSERFRQFYLPDGSVSEIDEVISNVLESRSGGINTRLGGLSARQLVYCECRHAGIFDSDTDSLFSISDPERTDAENLLQQNVDEVVASTLETVADIRSSKVLEHMPPVATSTIALSGLVMAMRAHRGQFRQNGKEYFTHPASVAAILASAWTTFPAVPENEITDNIFLGYTHDAFEDLLTKDGTTFLNDANVESSPLVTEGLYRSLGKDADEVAEAQFFLTKTIGTNGRKMKYRPYIQRGKQSRRFVTVKLADMQHNLKIDPKPAYDSDFIFSSKTSSKKDEYRDSQTSLLRAAESVFHNGLRELLFLSRITAIKSDDIRPFELANNIERTIKSIVESR